MAAKHGGKRAGAGRPKKYPGGTVPLVATVPAGLLPLAQQAAAEEGISLSELVAEAVRRELVRRAKKIDAATKIG